MCACSAEIELCMTAPHESDLQSSALWDELEHSPRELHCMRGMLPTIGGVVSSVTSPDVRFLVTPVELMAKTMIRKGIDFDS